MSYLHPNIDNYIISPLFLLLLSGSILGIVMFLLLIRFQKTPGVKYWMIWQLTTAFWAFTYAFEFAATDIETKIMWSKLSYFGIVYCTLSFLFFSLEFTSNHWLLKKKFVFGAYALATLFIVSPLTNGLHHLHWKSYSINPETNATNYVYGPFFWVIFLFSYLTLIIGIINIVILFFRMSGYYRRQITLLFIACLLPPAGNLIYVFHLNPVPGFDWTPLTFLLTGILIAINISQYKMFDLVPFARNKLIDIIPDAILIVDKSLRVADHNPALLGLIGPNTKGIIGKRVDEIFPNRENLISAITNEDEFKTEVSRESDDEIYYYDLSATALYDHDKVKNGRLIVLKDITRHKKSKEAIRETNLQLKTEIEEKEKLINDLDAFSHTVAHDLKNMLGAIVTASSIIKSGIDDMPKEDLLEINDLINQSATKTMHITRELLTLASARQQEIKALPVNMQKVVLDSMSRLRDMIDDSKVKIILPESWPEVLGYEAWLEEVWINYISNAIKYGGTPPEIKIGFESVQGNRVKFWIKDNGKGLKESEIALLFNKFTRLDTLRAEGHGLGLSIVKRIIQKLNGEVGIESQNIAGEGSSFYFILPKSK